MDQDTILIAEDRGGNGHGRMRQLCHRRERVGERCGCVAATPLEINEEGRG